jgi:hypothetical protein
MNLNHNRLTHTQIVEAFPNECKTILPREIKRIKRIKREYDKHIERMINSPYDKFSEWFAVEALKILYPKKIFDYLNNLEALQRLVNNQITIKNDMKFTEEQLQMARLKPLLEIHNFEKLKKTGQRYVALCPFHTEKSGSFIIYPSQTFHCFGCHISGNPIDFLMKLEGLTFQSAVERLIF